MENEIKPVAAVARRVITPVVKATASVGGDAVMPVQPVEKIEAVVVHPKTFVQDVVTIGGNIIKHAEEEVPDPQATQHIVDITV